MVYPTRLVLIRHAEVEERYQRVFGGRIDMELSPRGHEQAAAMSKSVRQRPVDAIYVSPMRRAQQTMVPLASHCPKPAMTRPELREVDFGDWTGLTWEQVRTRHGVNAFRWLEMLDAGAIPNAETGQTWRARVEPCVREIVQGHAGQTVAILCHGGIVRMILSILLDLPLPKISAFEIDYASVTRVEQHAHKTEVTLLNFAPWRDLP
jgi:broad specificity phosphatase PhoE